MLYFIFLLFPRKFKMLRWWCQSFLVGISQIICGFRDDSGLIEGDGVTSFSVHKIPEKCCSLWSANVCMHFLDRFLNWCRCVMRHRPDRTTVIFHFDPVQALVNYEAKSECSLLPDWFTTRLFQE